MRRLIPLNAARAFEAAARQLSFTRAADELHVTPAAVSHQVRLLEQFLNVKLFERLNRSVRLTPEGRSCLERLSEGFDLLDDALARTQAGRLRARLTIRASPSFAALWLLPRLPSFEASRPDVDVNLLSSSNVAAFERDDFDVAVRYTRGNHPDLRVERLMDEEIFPVCAPSLLATVGPLDELGDLARHRLLHDDTLASFGMFPTWQRWLDRAGAAQIDGTSGARFNLASLAVQAAAAGRGVLLGRSRLVEGLLADGRLARPLPHSYPTRFACYLLSARVLRQAHVAAFREWILDMARPGSGDATGKA